MGQLYSELQAVDSFGLSLLEYRSLPRAARKALWYYLMMKSYFEEQSIKKAKQKAEKDAKYRAKLPRQRIPRRRGR